MKSEREIKRELKLTNLDEYNSRAYGRGWLNALKWVLESPKKAGEK